MTLPAKRRPYTGPMCGARSKRTGRPCGRGAGDGTDHPGEGNCKWHGGVSGVLTHGRYSKVKRERVRELIAVHNQDPEPLNVLPELAAARALFQDFIERYDEWREALLFWWAVQTGRKSKLEEVRFAAELVRSQWVSTGDPEKDEQEARARQTAAELVISHAAPRQILDVSAAQTLVDTITKIVKRIEDIRNANAISRPDLARLMHEMARVVERHVQDEKTLELIRDGWLELRT